MLHFLCKRIALALLLSVFVSQANELPATLNIVPQSPTQRAISKNEVSAAVKALNNVLVNPDRQVLMDLTWEDLTYGHSSGKIQDREEFIDDVLNGPFDFSEVAASEEQIQISGDTAIARHIMTAQATNAGAPVAIRIGIIMVFKKHKGKLKLWARQAYKL